MATTERNGQGVSAAESKVASQQARGYALQGYCLCAKCESIREAELTHAERHLAMLPAATLSAMLRRATR